jgi:hypothetical protein
LNYGYFYDIIVLSIPRLSCGVILIYKGELMAWDAINTVPAMHGKSLALRELFAKTANATLAKGQTEEEAIFSGISAVKIQEKKNQPPKAVAPKVPAHLAAVRSYESPYDMVSKAAEITPTAPNIKAAEFDNQDHLVLLMSDNTKIVSKTKAVQENIEQSVYITKDYKPFLAMQEPTGFQTRATSTLSFDDTTRTFTIAATNLTNGFNIWLHANEITRYTESVQIENTTGVHFIYFDYPDNELKSVSTATPELFLNTALVAVVYWRADLQKHVYFADERHGMVMDGATHQHLHLSIGAQYRNGLALGDFSSDGNGSANTHCQFSCSDGHIADEDLLITITNNAPQELSTIAHIPIYYRHGNVWGKKTANAYPVITPNTIPEYISGSRCAYNVLNNGSWDVLEVPNNQYFLVHVLATNDIEHPIVGILGNTYQNKPQAQTGALNELKYLTGLPFLEFVKLGTVIFQTSDSFTNTPKAAIVSTDTGTAYIDYRPTGASLVVF